MKVVGSWLPRRHNVMWASYAAGVFLLGAPALDAQVVRDRPAVGTGIVHIRSISPRSGPAGSEIRVRAAHLGAPSTPLMTSVRT